jgi:hypothetical protein
VTGRSSGIALCIGLLVVNALPRGATLAAEANVQSAATQPLDEVVVESLRHPEARSYARLVQGTRIFQQYRQQLAPRASLRFRVYPRKAGVDMHGLQLAIVSRSARIPVGLDSELRFEVPIDQTALNENADLIYNRRDGTLGWRTDVRTAGIPENMRRLGDLRLECRVELMGAHVARGFNPFGFMGSALGDPCDKPGRYYHFYADRPIFAVTLRYGERSAWLSTGKLYGNDVPEWQLLFMDWPRFRERVFLAPLRNTTWPDETLLEFDYMDATPESAAPPLIHVGTSTKADVAHIFGDANIIDKLGSGEEVWAYRYAEKAKAKALRFRPGAGARTGRPDKPAHERVILFDRAGVVTKSGVHDGIDED